MPNPCSESGRLPEIGDLLDCLCGLGVGQISVFANGQLAEYNRWARRHNNIYANDDFWRYEVVHDETVPFKEVRLQTPSSILRDAVDQCSGGGIGKDIIMRLWDHLDGEDCPEPPIPIHPSVPATPVDPNDIIGYSAMSGSLAISANQMQLPYLIEFENDSLVALGMAHVVIVNDTLDSSVFDLNSFSATSFSIGDIITTINGGQSFTRTVDLRPTIDVIVQVQLDYHIDTTYAVATWTFSSLNPMTLQPAVADTLGFLAIGGTGEVNFTINRKANLSDSVLVNNRAWITFDNEQPIATSTWRNYIDNTPPSSVVDSISYLGDTAIVFVNSIDNLSGVWRYVIYAQLDDDVLLPVAINIPADTTVSFVPPIGTVMFHSTAIDSAGNIEPISIVRPTYFDSLFVTTCENYIWFDSSYTASGEYVHVSSHSFSGGYDTVMTLHLTIKKPTHVSYFETTCENFTWNGTNYTTSGDYIFIHEDENACLQVDTLHLVVNYSNTGDTTAFVCDSFDWYEHTGITQSCENLTHTFTNAAGCDSIVTLHLIVNYSNTGDTAAIVCDSFDWYEHVGITQSCENLTHTFTNAAGCDSVVTLHLTVNYSNTGDTTAIVCDSFDWYEHTGITQSCENLTHTFTNATGCDSVVRLHLTVNYSNTGDTTAVACNSFDWYEHMGITQSCENLMHTFTNVAGCDSAVTLHLTVNYSNTGDTIAVACDSFDWHEHTGVTQSCENLTHTFTNAAGCDSVVTLHLTIHNPVHTAVTETACETFTWNETEYTISGDYTYSHVDANGCTQVDTLHMTIFNDESSEFSNTTDDSCYTWNSQTYCASGDYTQILQTVHGCDSVVTLHLTITVGVDNYDGFDFKVYPNPTSNIVNVQITNHQSQITEIQLVDAFGRLLRSSNVVETDAHGSSVQTQIDLSRYATGIYFVKAVADGKTVAVRKVVKQ